MYGLSFDEANEAAKRMGVINFSNQDWEPLRTGTIIAMIQRMNFLYPTGTYRTLVINNTNLRTKSAKDLKDIVGAIPAGFKMVSFNNNDLSHLTPKELSDILASLPESVEKVSLKGCGLSNRSIADLEIIYSQLVGTVQVFDDVNCLTRLCAGAALLLNSIFAPRPAAADRARDDHRPDAGNNCSIM